MKIEINPSDGADTSTAIEQHVRSKLSGVERRFGERITVVEVYMKDTNSDKGGIDKICTLEAHPGGLKPVAVEATDADLYTAIHQAAKKLEKAMEHRISRADAQRG